MHLKIDHGPYIIDFIRRKGRVEITYDFALDWFDLPKTGLESAIIVTAHAVAGSKVPPQNLSEALDAFCKANGLRWEKDAYRYCIRIMKAAA